LFGDQDLKLVTVWFVGVGNVGLQGIADFYIVVSIDAENVFNDVHIALNINAVSRNFQFQQVTFFRKNFDVQRLQDGFDLFGCQDFTNQCICFSKTQ